MLTRFTDRFKARRAQIHTDSRAEYAQLILREATGGGLDPEGDERLAALMEELAVSTETVEIHVDAVRKAAEHQQAIGQRNAAREKFKRIEAEAQAHDAAFEKVRESWAQKSAAIRIRFEAAQAEVDRIASAESLLERLRIDHPLAFGLPETIERPKLTARQVQQMNEETLQKAEAASWESTLWDNRTSRIGAAEVQLLEKAEAAGWVRKGTAKLARDRHRAQPVQPGYQEKQELHAREQAEFSAREINR